MVIDIINYLRSKELTDKRRLSVNYLRSKELTDKRRLSAPLEHQNAPDFSEALVDYIPDIIYNHFILINNNACTVYGMGLTKEYVINFIDGGSPLQAPLFEIMSAEDAKAFVESPPLIGL